LILAYGAEKRPLFLFSRAAEEEGENGEAEKGATEEGLRTGREGGGGCGGQKGAAKEGARRERRV